jgi:hypothetical protein
MTDITNSYSSRRLTLWPRCRNRISKHKIVETPRRGVSTFPLNLEVDSIVINWGQGFYFLGGQAGHVKCNYD